MRVTKEVADILNGAFDIAQKEQYEYVTPELLLSLIARRPIFQEAFEACGGDVERLEDNLRAYLMQNMEPTGLLTVPPGKAVLSNPPALAASHCAFDLPSTQ